MEKLEENCKKVKDEISQSIDSFILELQLRKKCLFEEVDALVAMESNNKHKTIKFTNGDKNVVLSAIRNFGVVFEYPQLASGCDLSSQGVPRGMTVGPTISDKSSETDESSSADSDSIAVSDKTEMKNLSDTIVMFPQRCLTKCKNVYQGEILSRVLSNRQCAIKFPQETDQSNKEVKILGKLGKHTHVISLIQSGVVDSIFKERFLVLELCCEDDLNQYLTNKPYSLKLSLRYCIQIIEGMKYIHDKCIIHKDLKPSNILLTLDRQRVKIADFGISQEIKSKRSMVFCEYRFGTVGYRPPESFGNAYISLKSDIFSLGALFHYIMSYGKSSFGPEPDLRDSNIIKGNVRIAHLLVPNPNTFSHLFKLMMSKERCYRPTIRHVEDHPCWRLEERDCEFDYGCADEIDDAGDERAHSPEVEVVDPFDEFANLRGMLEILEPEEERIHNNKERRSAAEVLRRYWNKGRAMKYFGTGGKAVGQMRYPQGICSTATDDLLLADFSNHRIQIFDVNGRVKGCFGSKGTEEGQFDGVADVCVTSRGRIVATDPWNHRIQIFDERGRFVRKFGSEGSGDGELSLPAGVATDESGLIYVCDKGNDRVQVFSEEGKFVREFGSESLNKPQFLSVTSNGRVVVSDWNGIYVFDSYGRHLLQFGTGGTNESEFQQARGVATDDHGNMVVCDYDNNRVQIFTSDGEFVSCFGSYGSEPGQMNGPTGVCLLSDGRIVVTDWGNHRVQIF